MAGVTALHRSDEAVFASHGDVFLVVWRTGTTVQLVGAMGRLVERFAAAHPAGVSMVVVVEEGCQMPDGPTRARMAADMKRHESFTRQMALVYEGTGFGAARAPEHRRWPPFRLPPEGDDEGPLERRRGRRVARRPARARRPQGGGRRRRSRRGPSAALKLRAPGDPLARQRRLGLPPSAEPVGLRGPRGGVG
jgi:hypothetical protein